MGGELTWLDLGSVLAALVSPALKPLLITSLVCWLVLVICVVTAFIWITRPPDSIGTKVEAEPSTALTPEQATSSTDFYALVIARILGSLLGIPLAVLLLAAYRRLRHGTGR